jgi:5-methyltetrahydrofolate--homocysteine methyltransferase
MEADHESAGRTNGKIVLATVKGDVHDIGKNIVGVVLQCNNYDVVDLGVMVSADKILETARKENADIIGLSGLITPSLDEMVHVAHEMKRLELETPLLIGGATTSKLHTAVKIVPEYDGVVVHVLDASRAVGVASKLLGAGSRETFAQETRDEYARIRERRESRDAPSRLVSLAQARNNKLRLEWSTYTPPRPSFLGTRVLAPYPLDELRTRIDWTPFFRTWELAGRYPTILQDSVVGPQACNLFDDAQTLLDRIVKEEWLEARAVLGFFPSASVDDDVVELYDETRRDARARLHFVRQQIDRSAGATPKANLCLADFVAPRGSVDDYIGAFAVTAGVGIDKRVRAFEAAHDDYNAILLKALADRLAEAFAERLHERVRREFWGYAADEVLSNEDLIAERYRGIRPPAIPLAPTIR